jgi:hypothetical protein
MLEVGNAGDASASPDSENEIVNSQCLGKEENGKIILKAINVQKNDAGRANSNEDVPTS